MKFLILILSLLMSMNTSAESNKEINNKIKKEPKGHPVALSTFDVIPLNSPIKESVARFLIKTPDRFDIDEVSYQVKNSGRIFEKPRAYQKINLVEGPEGKELRINVSKLAPGFYQLLVKVKDKSKKEHHFKTKFKDHAMFVVDSSLQVPMPDPLKNNATLLGIDSDNDGIRDDVQRWINENLSNKSTDIKLAFKQYAVAMQASLPTSNDKQASIQSSLQTSRAQGCLYRTGDESGLSGKAQEELRKKIDLIYLNTRERIEAEIKADENFHGQEVTVLSKEEACNF